MKIKNSFHTYALITVFCWALAYVYTRLALRYFSPYPLGFLRYFFASCCLLPALFFGHVSLPRRRDLPLFLAAGATGFALYISIFNLASVTVTAATSSVIVATSPVVIALLARLIYGESLSLCKWLASGIEFCGVAVLTLLDGVFSLNTGIFWLFAAVLSFSCYNLLQRRLTRHYTPLQTCTYSIFAGTLLLAVFLPSSLPELAAAPPQQLFYLAMLAVFPSAIAYFTWAKALAAAEKTSLVSNYMFLTPFITSVLAFGLAGESLDRATISGGGIILLGLALFLFGDKLIERLHSRGQALRQTAEK